MNAKKFLHSNKMSEWDTIFDPGGKQEYTEEQLIRFAEKWAGLSVQDFVRKMFEKYVANQTKK